MKHNRKAVAFILTLALVLCSGAVAFADIDYSQWDAQSAYPSDIVNTEYFSAVRSLMDKGAVTGDTDGLFHPDNLITRAQFSKIITIATNNTGNIAALEEENIFADLSGAGWAKGYINCAAKAGIVQGVGENKFAPGNNVTYAEAITMIIRTKAGAADAAEAMGTWPQNYITYAQMYNRTGDVLPTNWNTPATKGDVAKLIYRNMPKSSAGAASVTITSSGAVLTAAATGGGGTLSYQWYKNNGAISGAIGSSYDTSSASGSYYVAVTTTKVGYSDTTVYSNTIVLP